MALLRNGYITLLKINVMLLVGGGGGGGGGGGRQCVEAGGAGEDRCWA